MNSDLKRARFKKIDSTVPKESNTIYKYIYVIITVLEHSSVSTTPTDPKLSPIYVLLSVKFCLLWAFNACQLCPIFYWLIHLADAWCGCWTVCGFFSFPLDNPLTPDPLSSTCHSVHCDAVVGSDATRRDANPFLPLAKCNPFPGNVPCSKRTRLIDRRTHIRTPHEQVLPALYAEWASKTECDCWLL